MVRKFLRSTKAKLVRFNKAQPAVLVFGLRRGGSTMLSDAISANRGVWFADEPYAMFAKRKGYPEKSARLFTPPHSHFFDLANDQQSQFAAFSHDLLDAQFRTMGTARHTKAGFAADRVCLKILNAPWMMPWFAAETDAHIISVTRHPGAQARSCLRQNWGFPVEAYLQRDKALTQAFSAKQIAFAHDVFAAGDPWQIAVLDWIVTSYPLRTVSHPKITSTSYEDVVADPMAFIDDVLIGACALTERDRMEQAILRPSGSSHLNTADATKSIANRDVDKILNAWRSYTSDEELESGQKILDTFEIDTYRFAD